MVTFVTDLVALFTPVAAQIASQRDTLGLPALRAPSPTAAGQVGGLLIGQEWLRREHSAPRIVVVPTGCKYSPAQRVGVQTQRTKIEGVNPRARENRLLTFDVHLWGDPDPTGANALQDFNA